jgi:hypothetical protein
LEIFKNSPVWDCLACHSFTFKTLSCHGLGMACHGMSREVTGCHVKSKGKWGVANLETQLYKIKIAVDIFYFKIKINKIKIYLNHSKA